MTVAVSIPVTLRGCVYVRCPDDISDRELARSDDEVTKLMVEVAKRKLEAVMHTVSSVPGIDVRLMSCEVDSSIDRPSEPAEPSLAQRGVSTPVPKSEG